MEYFDRSYEETGNKRKKQSTSVEFKKSIVTPFGHRNAVRDKIFSVWEIDWLQILLVIIVNDLNCQPFIITLD